MTGETVTCLTGIKPVSIDYPRKVAHRRGNSTGRLVVGNCAPDCALTGVYPRQTPSLTGRHGERPLGGQPRRRILRNGGAYALVGASASSTGRCCFRRTRAASDASTAPPRV